MIRRPREAHITPPAAGTPLKHEKPQKRGGNVDSMSIHEIEAKARELRQLQQLIEEATAEAEAIKDQIKTHMGDSEELRAGEYKITWKPVTTSRLDGAALKRELPEIAARFLKQTTGRRFCLV